MTIYPAIDIFEAKAVRLKRGDYAQMTVYSDDPVSVARSFKEAGATAIHIVDLEGARAGEPKNSGIIAKIAAETGLFVQTGGGIRTVESIEMYLNAGIKRVILGTAAVAEPGFLREMVAKFGAAIAVSADIKDGLIAIKGWEELTNQELSAFCTSVAEIGVKTIICTDISKDGMQGGTNIGLYRTLARELTNANRKNGGLALDIIASGGVSTPEDIKTLASLGIHGAIIGKALYEGTIDLKEALQFSK